jgi:hypothetical protein
MMATKFYSSVLQDLKIVGFHTIKHDAIKCDERYEQQFICKFMISDVLMGIYQPKQSEHLALKAIGWQITQSTSKNKIIHISNLRSIGNSSDRLKRDMQDDRMKAILTSKEAFDQLTNHNIATIYNFEFTISENTSDQIDWQATHTISLINNFALKQVMIIIDRV